MLIDDLNALTSERQLDHGTEANYRRAIRNYSTFLGHPALRADLTEAQVNAWLKHLETQYKPPTVIGHKRGITVLWNWLASRNEVPHYNQNRMRRIRVPRKPPVAWSIQNVIALLKAAQQMPGKLRCGIKLSDLMTAWVSVAYETGMRPKDMMLLTFSSIVQNRVFIVQHKTQQPHMCSLSKPTMDAIERLRREGTDAVFGIPKSTMRAHEVRLFELAKTFGFDRRKGQSVGTLSKTHGTEIAREHGLEAAAHSLGHISGTNIARDHYVQPDALAMPPAPPEIDYGQLGSTGTTTDNRPSAG